MGSHSAADGKTLHILPLGQLVKHGCHRLRGCSFQCHAWDIRRPLEERGSFAMGLLGTPLLKAALPPNNGHADERTPAEIYHPVP